MEALTDRLLRTGLLNPRISLPVVVVHDGTIADWNEAAREAFVGEIGQPVESLFDADSRHKLTEAIAAAPASCEIQAATRKPEPEVMRVVVIPSAPGEYLLLVGGMGATYSEQMARQLLRANDHLTNLARELSRQTAELEVMRGRFESLANLREHFISMLAHDVRGALQGVGLTAEIIERAADAGNAEQVRQGVERIRGNTKRIAALVDKVLEAARTETGRIALETQAIALAPIAREVIEVYQPIAQLAGVGLVFVDHAGNATVSGDRVRLGQVFGNLLENAIRHSPRGGTVTLDIEATPRTVRLAVRDQGPGIPAELRAQLFERFVQGPMASGSVGLGLFVARQLVELHGGHIEVADVVPQGAAMTVELPRIGGNVEGSMDVC